MTMLIEASAGTRKTTRLIGSVLDALLLDGVGVHEIAAITFTAKAAAEMRTRLASALRAVLRDDFVNEWDMRASEKRPLHDLQSAARMAYREIDRAFIGTLHSFCLRLLRLYPREAGVPPVLEADEGDRFDALFDAAWESWKGANLTAVLAREAPLDVLRDLARAMAEFRTPAALLHDAAFAKHLRKQSMEILRDARDSLEALRKKYPADARGNTREERLDFYARVLDEAMGDKITPETRRRLRTWKAAHIGLGSQPTKWSDSDWNETCRIEELARDCGTLDDDRAHRVVRALTPFVQQFRADFLAGGFITFDGMLALARDLLSHRDVRQRLKPLFKRLFVDEFQDTDPVQYEIVLAMAERPDSFHRDWRKIEVEKGRLMVVGDPKQSIYSFRGADLEAYTTVKDVLLKAGEMIRPDENFRSCPNLVNAVNAVFEKILPDYARLKPMKTELCAGRTDCVRAVRIEAAGNVDEATEAEATWVAAEIARQSEGARYHRFAILLRKLTRAHLFMEALRRQGIPYVIEGDKAFYRQPEVLDLFNWLAAVADPADRIALLGVLRSCKTDREILDAGLAPIDPLPELRAMAGRVPAPDVVREVFRRTPILASARAGYRGEIAVANLFKILHLASRATARADVSLRSFVEELRRKIRETEDEGEDPLADENHPAVRLMSIHKAKGLEFDVVFVPLLWQAVEGQERGASIDMVWSERECGVRTRDFFDLASISTAKREAEVRDAEARRLLYVAMTRARERVVLCGVPNTRPPEASFAEILAGAPLAWEDVKPPEAPLYAATAAREAPDLAARWAEIERLRAEASKDRFTTPSAGKAFAGGGTSRGAEIGSICHAALETLDFAKPDLSGVADADARALLQKFVASPAFERLRRAKILGREIPFLLPQGDLIMSGRIDLLYEEDGAIVVADYKTDRAASAAELVERYKAQMQPYAAIVRALFPDRPVRAALIWLPHSEILELQSG